MCGISGFYDPAGFDAQGAADIVARMSTALRHRGPDDVGAWIDGAAGMALGHRRLSIVDLSPAGHQPMSSRSGRFVIAFNGEIYNHSELRLELDKAHGETSWKGRSDTETFLEAVAKWGFDQAIAKAVGMFAFALWDRQERRLTLARDRLGEKPLYYGWIGSRLAFASELKALASHPSFERRVSADVVALYLKYDYVPCPWSIYEGIWKLPAGTSLSFGADTARDRGAPRPYWSPREIATSAMADPFRGDDLEAEHELEALLRQSISGQMVADVPVAAFLSGGIDSSSVVAVMQSIASKPVRTFSIGFHEDGLNEAEYAAEVAKHLGTDHTELYVTPRQALDVVPLLPDLYDEPFGDSSQIPTYLMACLTRRQVTVALSGDGGDELFGGYTRYFLGRKLWGRIGLLPRPLRSASAKLIRSIPTSRWDSILALARVATLNRWRSEGFGEKLYKLSTVLDSYDGADFFRQLVSLRWPKETARASSARPEILLHDPSMWLPKASFLEQMMFLDLVTYLTDDILVKVDRAAMGASLETRVPMLDHRLVEFSWRLPSSMKVRDGEGKYILKRLLHKFVPKAMVDRPKMGFGVPIESWLRGPLREWAESLLSEQKIERQGYLDAKIVRKRWSEHVAGSANWHYDLWCVLMLQAWLERWWSVPSGPQGSANYSHVNIEMASSMA